MPNYFSHENAIVESKNIGSGTRIWAFAHVLPGATIGADCNICDGVFIENDVDSRRPCHDQMWRPALGWHHLLEDDVFVGPKRDIHQRSNFPEAVSIPSRIGKTTLFVTWRLYRRQCDDICLA
jgi:UDP-2-acetamido-3-amino-2,3-dideoxy-glucuronate N-acetyltransferase